MSANETEIEQDGTEGHQAEQHVSAARSFLADFEDEPTEIRYGQIKHAIAELENARRELPDDY